MQSNPSGDRGGLSGFGFGGYYGLGTSSAGFGPEPKKERNNACFNCNQEGHRSSECPETKKERNNACYNCGMEGHRRNECPGRRGYSGFGAGTDYRGGNYDQSRQTRGSFGSLGGRTGREAHGGGSGFGGGQGGLAGFNSSSVEAPQLASREPESAVNEVRSKICSLCNKSDSTDELGVCADCFKLHPLVDSLEAAEKENLKSLITVIKNFRRFIGRDILLAAVENPSTIERMLESNINIREARSTPEEVALTGDTGTLDFLKSTVPEKNTSLSLPEHHSTFSCVVCFEEKNTDQAISCVRAPGAAQTHKQHTFCRDCVSGYAKNAAEQASVVRAGIGLKCMQPGCRNGVFLCAHIEPLLQGRSRKLLEEKIADKALAAAAVNVERCLREGCSWGGIVERPATVQKVFACMECGYKYCRICKSDWTQHRGKRCEVVNPDYRKREAENELSMSVVNGIHRCEFCNTPIEKVGGCNKVTCCEEKVLYQNPGAMRMNNRKDNTRKKAAAAGRSQTYPDARREMDRLLFRQSRTGYRGGVNLVFSMFNGRQGTREDSSSSGGWGDDTPGRGGCYRPRIRSQKYWKRTQRGIMKLSTLPKFELLEPDGTAWPIARSGHRTFVYDNFLYVIGGFTNDPKDTILRELWKFDVVSHKWTKCTLPDVFPNTLASFACQSSGNGAFTVYGGTGTPFGQELDDAVYKGAIFGEIVKVEKIHPLGNKPGSYGHVLVLDPASNKIYSIGGTNGTEYNLDVHALDRNEVSGKWEWKECAMCKYDDLDEFKQGRYRMEAILENDSIYIFGGGTNKKTPILKWILVFNIEQLRYQYIDTKPDPVHGSPVGRKCHSLVQWGRNVIIAGGCHDDANKNNVILGCVWSFNLDTHEWRKMNDLPIPVCFHDASVTKQGKMLIFGGLSQSGRTAVLQTLWLTQQPVRPIVLTPVPVQKVPEPEPVKTPQQTPVQREEVVVKKYPDRWENYKTMVKPMTGTRFVAFKCPLDEAFFDNGVRPNGLSDIPALVRRLYHLFGRRLGMVIDLTKPNVYYDPNIWSYNVDYRKMFTPFYALNGGEGTVYRFNKFVDEFLEKNEDNDKLIGVHCTRGVNLTGYLMCRYTIDRMNWTADEAIRVFEECRGHPIEAERYKERLHDAQRRRDSARIERAKDAKTASPPLQHAPLTRPTVSVSPVVPRQLPIVEPPKDMPAVEPVRSKICSQCNKICHSGEMDGAANGKCANCLKLSSLVDSLAEAEMNNLKSLVSVVNKCRTGVDRDLLLAAVDQPAMIEKMLAAREASVQRTELALAPPRRTLPTRTVGMIPPPTNIPARTVALAPPPATIPVPTLNLHGNVGIVPQVDWWAQLETFTCPNCFDDLRMDQGISCVRAPDGRRINEAAPPHERHLFCRECVTEYAEQAVEVGSISHAGLGLKCMQLGCTGIFLYAHVDSLLHGRSRELLGEKIADEALAAIARQFTVERCIRCSWGATFSRCERGRRWVTFTCGNEECGFEYCRTCKTEWKELHRGKRCEDVNPEFVRRKVENALSERAVALMHHCPKCKRPIEKVAGCKSVPCCGIKRKAKNRVMSSEDRAAIIQQAVADAGGDPLVLAELNKIK